MVSGEDLLVSHAVTGSFCLSVGWSGTEDYASDANLQDLKAGPPLDRPPCLWLHPATVLPAGSTGSAAHIRKH